MPLTPTREYAPLDDSGIQDHVEQRPGGAGQLSYIPGGYIIQRLHEVFPGQWEWSIIRHDVVDLGGQLIVVTQGTLEVQINGESRTFDGIGSEELTARNAAMVHKSSATDALKRAAMLLGMQFGLSLYPGTEADTQSQPAAPVKKFVPNKIQEIEIPPPPPRPKTVIPKDVERALYGDATDPGGPEQTSLGKCQYKNYKTNSLCGVPTGMIKSGQPMRFCPEHVKSFAKYRQGQA